MKIAYISTSTIPSKSANSVHVMKMCQAIVRSGHSVLLFAQNRRTNVIHEIKNDFDYYGIDKCFRIIKIPWLPVFGRSIIYSFLSAIKARINKVDLAFCRSVAGAYFSAKFGLPVILEVHAPILVFGRFSEILFKRLIRSSNLKKLVVITHSLKKYLVEKYNLINVDVVVSPDGADEYKSDDYSPILINKTKQLNAGYVGGLYTGKGVEIIMLLAKECSWADFHIIGGSDEEVNSYKKEFSSLKNITFYGYQPPSKVNSYLQSFDVVLMPNQEKMSTFGGNGDIGKWTSPLKMFEYMSAAKPIIASRLEVLQEILEHEVNSLLCVPDNISDWKTSLERLRDDVKLRKFLGDNALSDFLKNYTWKIRAKNLLNNI